MKGHMKAEKNNDYYNACQENWNEIKATFNEENQS